MVLVGWTPCLSVPLSDLLDWHLPVRTHYFHASVSSQHQVSQHSFILIVCLSIHPKHMDDDSSATSEKTADDNFSWNVSNCIGLTSVSPPLGPTSWEFLRAWHSILATVECSRSDIPLTSDEPNFCLRQLWRHACLPQSSHTKTRPTQHERTTSNTISPHAYLVHKPTTGFTFSLQNNRK